MKLQITGTPDGPDVLLLTGARYAPEEVSEGLPGLGKKYRLLTARGGSPAALADALRAAGVIRLWGAYALEEGATDLLALLAEGKIEARTAVTEGPFALPEASLRETPGTLICWKGGRDRKAKKAWEALKAQRPTLRSLTLDKLKGGQTYFSRRPDLMENRLIATFGEAAVIRQKDALLHPADKVWLRLGAQPAGALNCLLPETEPIARDEERFTQVLRGRGGNLVFWDHMLTVESAGDGASVCTDEAVFAAGKLRGLTGAVARLYMGAEQRRRAALLNRR